MLEGKVVGIVGNGADTVASLVKSCGLVEADVDGDISNFGSDICLVSFCFGETNETTLDDFRHLRLSLLTA